MLPTKFSISRTRKLDIRTKRSNTPLRPSKQRTKNWNAMFKVLRMTLSLAELKRKGKRRLQPIKRLLGWVPKRLGQAQGKLDYFYPHFLTVRTMEVVRCSSNILIFCSYYYIQKPISMPFGVVSVTCSHSSSCSRSWVGMARVVFIRMWEEHLATLRRWEEMSNDDEPRMNGDDWQQYPNPQRISFQDQPINLASAVRVSIDTAMQSCEVRKSVGMVIRAHELTSVDLLHCRMGASRCSRGEWW